MKSVLKRSTLFLFFTIAFIKAADERTYSLKR